MKLLLIALFAAAAQADTPPTPKVFQGMQGQKGQYQVEILEPAAPAGAQRMTVCTDNVLKRQGQPRRSASDCTYRLLKDTADEATIETTCNGRTSTVNVKRESAKSMLMTMQGEQTVRMRYTHLGACREGQGTVTLDPNSEQCRKLREQAAKARDRDLAARIAAMCN